MPESEQICAVAKDSNRVEFGYYPWNLDKNSLDFAWFYSTQLNAGNRLVESELFKKNSICANYTASIYTGLRTKTS